MSRVSSSSCFSSCLVSSSFLVVSLSRTCCLVVRCWLGPSHVACFVATEGRTRLIRGQRVHGLGKSLLLVRVQASLERSTLLEARRLRVVELVGGGSGELCLFLPCFGVVGDLLVSQQLSVSSFSSQSGATRV